jgi:hypothetical protein
MKPEETTLRGMSVLTEVGLTREVVLEEQRKDAYCRGKFEDIRGGLISPWPDQEGNKLQRPKSGFIQHTPHEAQYTS